MWGHRSASSPSPRVSWLEAEGDPQERGQRMGARLVRTSAVNSGVNGHQFIISIIVPWVFIAIYTRGATKLQLQPNKLGRFVTNTWGRKGILHPALSYPLDAVEAPFRGTASCHVLQRCSRDGVKGPRDIPKGLPLRLTPQIALGPLK